MASLVSDTHATIWYLLNDSRLSATARSAMENAATSGSTIYIPSISLVEITYLVEKQRFPETLFHRLVETLENPKSVLRLAPLDLAVSIALPRILREQVPDMPDRIIAATALALGLPLVTRDGKIQASDIKTIW